MDCPQCSGECYDNRQKNVGRRAQGKNPMPDFACKDKDGCGWKKWPPKDRQRSGKSPTGNSGPRWTWSTLSATYANCMKLAAKHIKELVPNATPADMVAATATLFITAARDGVQPVKKPEPPKPPPEPEAPEDEDQTGDDDLPW